jgi:hypothetical protein
MKQIQVLPPGILYDSFTYCKARRRNTRFGVINERMGWGGFVVGGATGNRAQGHAPD